VDGIAGLTLLETSELIQALKVISKRVAMEREIKTAEGWRSCSETPEDKYWTSGKKSCELGVKPSLRSEIFFLYAKRIAKRRTFGFN
jgi:hypothetical protein